MGSRTIAPSRPVDQIHPGSLLLVCSLVAGAAIVAFPARSVAIGFAALAVLGAVAIRPRFGAYVLLGITPLVAGIDRGAVIPMLRPSEAIGLLVGCGLAARGIFVALTTGFRRFRPSAVDVAVFVLAVASSVLPFLWMLVRGVQVTGDDLQYGLVLWKFSAIYLIFRTAVKTEREVRICLWIAMTVGTIVSVIAILQGIGVGAVVSFIGAHYTSSGDAQTAMNNRGAATFGLPIAAGDYLIFCLAIAVGCLLEPAAAHATTIRSRILLFGLAGLFAAGVLASGEFSAALGLLFALVLIAVIMRHGRLLLYMLPPLAIGLYVLRPVIEHRLAGFQSAAGLPVSWTTRLYNLRSYFWPTLFSHDNYLLGVRLSARVVVPSQITGYVWIESGYTWLLWAGGIPFLLAFVWFTYIGLRHTIAIARSRASAVGVAALASAVGLAVVALLMLFDPHLTYRGSADTFFALLALASVPAVGATRPGGAEAVSGTVNRPSRRGSPWRRRRFGS